MAKKFIFPGICLPEIPCEDLTDEEAREYADSISSEQAREHLNALLMEPAEGPDEDED